MGALRCDPVSYLGKRAKLAFFILIAVEVNNDVLKGGIGHPPMGPRETERNAF